VRFATTRAREVATFGDTVHTPPGDLISSLLATSFMVPSRIAASARRANFALMELAVVLLCPAVVLEWLAWVLVTWGSVSRARERGPSRSRILLFLGEAEGSR
jgi:hypothetical protein